MNHSANSARRGESPDFDQLRHSGWSVGTVIGQYCVAWRGQEEIVLAWRNGEWHQVSGRSQIRSAA